MAAPACSDSDRDAVQGGAALEQRRVSASTASTASTGAAHHFKHRPTLLRRLKSIRLKASELSAGGRASPTPRSPAFGPNRRASMSCRPRVPQPVLEDEQEDLAARERPSIKIRLVTFNMHDSLPVGDLTDFLGQVKGWRRRNPSMSTSRSSIRPSSASTNDSVHSIPAPDGLPQFPLTPAHPYHIIVVAGQECPTASGVLAGKIRTLDGYGWTSVLESWLCGGPENDETDDDGGAALSDNEGDSSFSLRTGGDGTSVKSKATTSGGDTAMGETRGPYVLVEKERLMGIYLAVFVAESCDGFINGSSKDRVTAGLIGGRLGNKGGVGISLSFAGSRLLFVSAHLAAHASGLEIRKANVKKILEELKVDDFSGRDLTAKPLTDRFDQCFFLGDLNMRLNLSRLHADWLAKARDWHIAMEFDQLRIVLSDPQGCLKGFQEAPIDFAPTYKYDVPPRIKKKRSGVGFRTPRSSKRSSKGTEAANLTLASDSPAVASPSTNELRPPGTDSDALSITSSQGSDMSDYDKIDRADLLGRPSLPDSTVEAVRRAQVRFMTLVRSNSALGTNAVRRYGDGVAPLSRKPPSGPQTVVPTRPILRGTQSDAVVPGRSRLEIEIDDTENEEVLEPHEPVFDSSAKQRVQSYTDRILFKSNVGYGCTKATPVAPSSPGVEHHLQPLTLPTPDTSHLPLHHSYFDARPVLDHPSKKITDPKTERPWSDVASVSGEPRHSRFANWFGRGHRRGIANRSVESLALSNSGPSPLPRPMTRAQSLHHIRRASLAPSLAPSIATSRSVDVSSKPFWKRTSVAEPLLSPAAETQPSLPVADLATTSRDSAQDATPTALTPSSSRASIPSTSPLNSPVDTAGTTPPHKSLPRTSTLDAAPSSRPPPPRRFSLFEGPAHPTSFFPRSLTRSTAARAASGRFKSFFHFLPLPFLGAASRQASEELPPVSPPRPERTGPRKGEVQVLQYDAVTDLARMGAVSDHRPVFCVLAIGIDYEDDDDA